MNKWEKEVAKSLLGSEKAILKVLEKYYRDALADIEKKIQILLADPLTQSRAYRLGYQTTLYKQVSGILNRLHDNEYETIQNFLNDTYTDSFVGTMYSLNGQGMPIISSVNPADALRAVVTDSKLSEPLYESLGIDINSLKKRVSAEITRGIAEGMSNYEIARNLRNASNVPLSRARTIARTESHRIQEAASYDAGKVARSKGADLVKQWDASLDGDTRQTHRELDGKIVEYDEYFVSSSGSKAEYPGGFGDPAEDINCRCSVLKRARSALDENELRTLQERAGYFGLDKAEDFEDFKKKYLNAAKSIENSDNYGIINSEDFTIGRSVGAKAKNYDIRLPNNEIVQLVEGTRVTNVQVIAGKGRNREIDVVPSLLLKYPGSLEAEWQKAKGVGYVDYYGEIYKAELHWYQEPSVGRVEWKVKPDADGNWFIDED